jgi:hypothetical protein
MNWAAAFDGPFCNQWLLDRTTERMEETLGENRGPPNFVQSHLAAGRQRKLSLTRSMARDRGRDRFKNPSGLRGDTGH